MIRRRKIAVINIAVEREKLHISRQSAFVPVGRKLNILIITVLQMWIYCYSSTFQWEILLSIEPAYLE